MDCGCMGLIASPVGCHIGVTNDETLDELPHESLIFCCHCDCDSTLLHPQIPRHFISNLLDLGLSTQGGPVSFCLIARMHSVGEGGRARISIITET